MSKKITVYKSNRGKEVFVKHDDLYFMYRKPSKKDIKREGRHLRIGTMNTESPTYLYIDLNGTKINTLKKILKAVKEIWKSR